MPVKSWGERLSLLLHDVSANADYCTAGYGVLTDAEREAVQIICEV